jgi:hypothetical protein
MSETGDKPISPEEHAALKDRVDRLERQLEDLLEAQRRQKLEDRVRSVRPFVRGRDMVVKYGVPIP